MLQLFESQANVLRNLSSAFKRSMFDKIPWNERAIMVLGARGTGKTTLFLQHLKEKFSDNEAIYLTLDDIYFKQHTLVETAKAFSQNGGKVLILDEVHKYPDWSREVKNIYDLLPQLKMLITGSSILEIQKSKADLSRRVLMYNLPELSFREFLAIKYSIVLPTFELADLLKNHIKIANELVQNLQKPLFYFKEYLNWGAYPIFSETELVHQRIKQTINLILESDLPNALPIELSTVNQLKKLLYIIAQSVPFKPNISKLAEQTGTSRPLLYEMLKMLEASKLIYALHSSSGNMGILNKPDKILMHNSNLLYALSEMKPEIGTIRESFFVNMLESNGNTVNYTEKGDFVINQKLTFEIGGKSKNQSQIKGVGNAFLALDEIETGYANTIPLWLFGFLY